MIMDMTQNGVPWGRKRKIAAILALLVIALALAGGIMVRGAKTSPDPMGVRTDKKVLAETRYIAGVVESITNTGNEGVIVVKSRIKDISVGSERYIEPEELRMIEKVYTVKWGNRSVFSGKNAEEIVVGDRVAITTKERIYERDTVTAVAVAYFDPKEETIARILGNRNMVAGTVVKVTQDEKGMTLAIQAYIPDENALRELDLSGTYLVPKKSQVYEVRVSPETKFTKGVTVDKVMEGVRTIVVVDGDIYGQTGNILLARTVEIE